MARFLQSIEEAHGIEMAKDERMKADKASVGFEANKLKNDDDVRTYMILSKMNK